MENLNLFATPVYVSGSQFDNAALIADVLEWRQADPAGMPRSNGGNSWHSQINAFERKPFRPLSRAILEAATEIFRAHDYPGKCRARLDSMWVNLHERGGYNNVHGHGGSLWSGVYHVTAPAGSGKLVLMDPRAQAHVVQAVGKNFARGDRCDIAAQAGQMVVFPGWLGHYVEPHKADEPRISVSFNIHQVFPKAEAPRGYPPFVSVPRVLTKDEITRVYAEIAGRKWGKGLVGEGRASAGRTNKVLFVDGKKSGSRWRWLYERVKHHAEIVNAATFKEDISGGGDMQFARYGPGEKYDEHVDRGPIAQHRTLSCALVLQPAKKGGGTHFPRAEEPPPHADAGDAVFFNAREPHAALPVEEGTRDVLIVWFNSGDRASHG